MYTFVSNLRFINGFGNENKNEIKSLINMNTAPSTSIKVTASDNKIKMNISSTIFYKVSSCGLSCYVPGFNFAFSAKDIEWAKRKTNAMTTIFLDHYISTNSSDQGLNKLYMQLYKNGFRPNDHGILLNELVKKGVRRNFTFLSTRVDNVPEGFDLHQQSEFESELAMTA
jgi:hypothetical protein